MGTTNLGERGFDGERSECGCNRNGRGKEDRTIGCGVCSQLARVELGEGGVKTKTGEKGGQRQKREKEEVKKQGQYTQRNVVLQTVELAKLKCTVTMGTLEEKKKRKRLTMKYRKRQRQYVLLNYILCLIIYT